MPAVINFIYCQSCRQRLNGVRACIRHEKSAHYQSFDQELYNIITQFDCELCDQRFDNVRDCFRHEKSHQLVDQAVDTPIFDFSQDIEIVDDQMILLEQPCKPNNDPIEDPIDNQQTASVDLEQMFFTQPSPIKVVIAPNEQPPRRGRPRGSKTAARKMFTTLNKSNKPRTKLKHDQNSNDMRLATPSSIHEIGNDVHISNHTDHLCFVEPHQVLPESSRENICEKSNKKSYPKTIRVMFQNASDNDINEEPGTSGVQPFDSKPPSSSSSYPEHRSTQDLAILRPRILEYWEKLPDDPDAYVRAGKKGNYKKLHQYRCKPCMDEEGRQLILKDQGVGTHRLERHLYNKHHLDLSAIYLNIPMTFKRGNWPNRKYQEDQERVKAEVKPYFEPLCTTGEGSDQRTDYRCLLCLNSGIEHCVRDGRDRVGYLRNHLRTQHDIVVGQAADAVLERKVKRRPRRRLAPEYSAKVNEEVHQHYVMQTPLDPNNFERTYRRNKCGITERRYQSADFICRLCGASIRCALVKYIPLHKHLKSRHRIDAISKYRPEDYDDEVKVEAQFKQEDDWNILVDPQDIEVDAFGLDY